MNAERIAELKKSAYGAYRLIPIEIDEMFAEIESLNAKVEKYKKALLAMSDGRLTLQERWDIAEKALNE